MQFHVPPEFVRVRLPLYTKRLEHLKSVVRAKLEDRRVRLRFLELVLGNSSAQVLANAEHTIRQTMGVTDDSIVARLLGTPVSDLSVKRQGRLVEEREALTAELAMLESKTGADLWREDLRALRAKFVSNLARA